MIKVNLHEFKGVDKSAKSDVGCLAKNFGGCLMKLEFITQEQAEAIKRKMPKTKVMQEYEDYLRRLPDKQVGRIEVSAKDDVKPYTIRNRLIRANKNLEIDIEVKRIGNVILFWKVSNDV